MYTVYIFIYVEYNYQTPLCRIQTEIIEGEGHGRLEFLFQCLNVHQAVLAEVHPITEE